MHNIYAAYILIVYRIGLVDGDRFFDNLPEKKENQIWVAGDWVRALPPEFHQCVGVYGTIFSIVPEPAISYNRYQWNNRKITINEPVHNNRVI